MLGRSTFSYCALKPNISPAAVSANAAETGLNMPQRVSLNHRNTIHLSDSQPFTVLRTKYTHASTVPICCYSN